MSAGTVLMSAAHLAAGSIALDGTWHQDAGLTTAQRFRGGGTLNIANFSTITINTGGGTVGTSRMSSLSVSPFAGLDLNDHDLAIDYTGASPLADVRTRIISGFNSGSWNGAGIRSSAAAAAASTSNKTGLGYAEASDVLTSFPATFSDVTVDNTSVLVRYTLLGDATLDRTVNIIDFSRLAANFNLPGGWSRGDFNYDGNTTIVDFSLLASNFNKTLAADAPARPGAVPEPATGLILTAAGMALGRRRRN
jgi:hypothetical protein